MTSISACQLKFSWARTTKNNVKLNKANEQLQWGSSWRFSPSKTPTKITLSKYSRGPTFCCWSNMSARFRPTAEKGTSPRVRFDPESGSRRLCVSVSALQGLSDCRWCRSTPHPLDGLERGVPRYNTRDSTPRPSGFSHERSAGSTPTRRRR